MDCNYLVATAVVRCRGAVVVAAAAAAAAEEVEAGHGQECS